jgi:hypothetical protein
MARSKPISVKIATAKVIKALETKLAETKSNYAKQDENEAKFQLKLDAWKKELFAFALANLDKAENTRTNYRSYSQNLNVDFDISVKEGEFPKEPEKDYEEIHRHTYNEMVEEMSNAIRILQMTDEEVVSTSTYNAIARYL